MKVSPMWLAVACLLAFGPAGCGAVSKADKSMTATPRDPAKTDPDKYHVVFENEDVRVLEYKDKPGDKTNQHSHPDSVLTAISAFKRKLHFPDGRTVEREFKAGEVAWIPAQTHIGENIGETETHVILTEVKHSTKK